MKSLTDQFIDALENWLAAWKAGDDDRAKELADEIRLSGDLLAIRPEFAKCFEKHMPLQPREALRSLSTFLICASDHRLNNQPNQR